MQILEKTASEAYFRRHAPQGHLECKKDLCEYWIIKFVYDRPDMPFQSGSDTVVGFGPTEELAWRYVLAVIARREKKSAAEMIVQCDLI